MIKSGSLGEEWKRTITGENQSMYDLGQEELHWVSTSSTTSQPNSVTLESVLHLLYFWSIAREF